MPQPIDFTRARFVLHSGVFDVTDPATHQNLIGVAETRERIEESIDLTLGDYPDAAITEIPGEYADIFTLAGEGLRYFESVRPGSVFLGQIAPSIEVYALGTNVLVVDDSGPGSPEVLATIDGRLRAPGVEPTEEEWDAADFDADSTVYYQTTDVLGSQPPELFPDAGSGYAVRCWELVEQLRAADVFDPATMWDLGQFIQIRALEIAAAPTLDQDVTWVQPKAYSPAVLDGLAAAARTSQR